MLNLYLTALLFWLLFSFVAGHPNDKVSVLTKENGDEGYRNQSEPVRASVIKYSAFRKTSSDEQAHQQGCLLCQ